MKIEDWKNSHIQTFWKDIGSCDHLVQVYENEKIFLDTLEGFAGTGFINDDSVIIIATQKHIDELDARLRNQHFDVDELRTANRYITIDAERALSAFMRGPWPDESKFDTVVMNLVQSARGDTNRPVRAFGEMVAVLWEKGLKVATVYLEGLWEHLCERENITVFCAYPQRVFKRATPTALDAICKTHTKIIDGRWHPTTEIYYRTA